VDNPTALDDALAAPSETEEQRRAREARIRAKRRLARAKADNAAARTAGSEEEVADGLVGTVGLEMVGGEIAPPAGGEAADGSGRASEEQAGGADAAGGDATADTVRAPSLPGPLILSNSIAAELEE
jgi:hypothetical protein